MHKNIRFIHKMNEKTIKNTEKKERKTMTKK